LDYRWLPETNSKFGADMAETYLDAAERLSALAAKLAGARKNIAADRCSILFEQESKRVAFEAAEFKAMHFQQAAMNKFAEFHNTRSKTAGKEGVSRMRDAVKAMDDSLEKAMDCGFSEKDWYVRNINTWLKREFNAKIAEYSDD
jgi:hypothetical protein